MRCIALLCVACVAAAPTLASAQIQEFDTPGDDRWQYPFNGALARPLASCFGTVGVTEFEFNDRDGILLVAWDTTTLIPAGLGPDNYAVKAVRVVLTNQASPTSIPEWEGDPTADEWFTYDFNGDGMVNADGVSRGQSGDVDGESDDPDPGRPIELFGVGFGDFFDMASWNENSPFIGGDSLVLVPRDPFPFVFRVNDDDTVDKLHVEDNVKGLNNDDLDPPVASFTPQPWAVGIPQGYEPGAQTTPFDITFEVDVCMSAGLVRTYFQEQLDAGRVLLSVTSLNEAFQMQQSNGFPNIFTKESIGLPGASAPRLIIELGAPETDCNANGIPDACDLAAADCNENGVPDDCDILSGDSGDEDENGIPDECVCETFADCADLDEDDIRDDNCVWWACQAGACIGTDVVFADMGGQFGACTPDGTADGNDRFQALNCFSNSAPDGTAYPCESAPPMAFNVDAGGQFGSCAPDGVCDGNDAFAALNAFGGTASCACPLDGGPMPAVDPVNVGTARLALATRTPTIAAGDLVDIEVFLDTPLEDLRGYQLHLGTSGGTTGELELVNISFDRNAHVLAARDERQGPRAAHTARGGPRAVSMPAFDDPRPFKGWSAFNVASAQMVAGLDTPGIAVRPGYMATFTFRADADARGRFIVDLLGDLDDPLQRTFLFPTLPHGRIEITPAKPVIITVRNAR